MSPYLLLLLIIHPPVDCSYKNLHHLLRGEVHAIIGHSIDNVLHRIQSSRSAGLRAKSGLRAQPSIHRRVPSEILLQNHNFLSERAVFQARVVCVKT
jgi:hypothetical protein